MKRKVVSVLMCLALVGTMLIGCSSSSDSSSEETATEEEGGSETYKIGFSQATVASPFYTTMVDTAQAYADELGIEIQIVSADEDVTKQTNDINDMIQSGIQCLIVNPVNSEGLATAFQACADANIPVVTVDRLAADGFTAAIVRDNKEMGRMVGECLLEELGGADKAQGTILEIQGTAGDQVMMARRDGFESVFENVPGIKIVQSVNCDYARAKAVTATQDLLQANDNVVAIYGHNDDMAVGAAQVCEEKGLTDIKICGVDGLMEAVKMIKEGKYVCTTMNDPATELKVGIDTAIKLIKGEEVDKEVDAGTGLINKDNVDDYVGESDFAEMK
ncbi:substrate-binding domain-containing protein [Faecalicatena contorta]|uniref:substrate-binding domain-containing protein n=1 Tax=Faecalicatena contorta TaxID=39482 RepID=UPI001F36D6B4|nr:substrate-binding domain-containing protein [Faecalicatena contorta]MCF2555408.1 substrate-binding domain-containing protein [Faecalicatena contorta]